MNKVFDEIRLIAKNSIGELQERIQESLDKLFEQVKQPASKSEEKVQVKRQSKVSEPEPIKKQKTEDVKEQKEPKELKEQKDQKEQRDQKEFREQKEVKDQKNTKELKEKVPEKRPKSEESSKDENQSDLESLGLDSNDSESSSEKSEPKEVGIADLPKNNENLSSVLKTLENPGDKLESILDYLISIIQGSDPSLQERIKRLDFEKKFGKLNVSSELKPKLKKIWTFVRDSAKQQPDHLKDLEILKKKLEGAIGRKIDTEILGMFRRFEDKLKEKLGYKEAEMLEEVIKTLQNLIKSYKNSEIRKSANSLVDKIRGKIEGISKKR